MHHLNAFFILEKYESHCIVTIIAVGDGRSKRGRQFDQVNTHSTVL